MPTIPQATPRSHPALWIALAIVLGAIVIAALVTLPSSFRQLRSTHVYRMAGQSMEPTLYAGDTITADMSYYTHHPVANGDIIVFHHDGTTLAKRVSAISGETIEGEGGRLIRNGVVLTEPYLHSDDPSENPQESTFSRRVVPYGQVFVTGDWRSRSLDSRYPSYAPVRVSDIIGKVVYVYASSHPGQQGRKF